MTDIALLLTDIKSKALHAENIFEYYADIAVIIKAVFRLPYSSKHDIILVVSNNKALVTMYLNEATDNHATLKHEQYSKE